MNYLNRALLLVCLLAFSTPAFALTAKERQIVLRAKAHLTEAQKKFDEARAEVVLAAQRAADAEMHAFATEELARRLQGDIDKAHANEQRLANENAKMKPVYDKVNKWCGLGAIIYGIGRIVHCLFWLVIGIAGLVILLLVASFFIPALGPIIGIVTRSFGSLWKRILDLLSKIRQKWTT